MTVVTIVGVWLLALALFTLVMLRRPYRPHPKPPVRSWERHPAR